MDAKDKKYLFISIGVLIFLVVLGYIFYRKGKKSANGPEVNFEAGTTQIPAGWNPVTLADELFDSMYGLFSLSTTKSEAWKKLYDLPTNDMVRAVYSAFNQKYFNKGSGTLTQWVRDEKYYDFTNTSKEQLLNRLSQLNLA